jgi:hypothetical protein
MKQQLNEVQRLQKIAGLLKENTLPKNMTINQVVKELNKIANSKGFYAVDKSPDIKPKGGVSGVKNLVRWEDDNENVVELYYNKSGKDITVDDLEIHFESDGSSGEDNEVEDWLDPMTWDTIFRGGEEDKMDDDELYN